MWVSNYVFKEVENLPQVRKQLRDALIAALRLPSLIIA
jgi:hypothetical protein